MCRSKDTKAEKWIITGIPILFLISPLFHSMYKLTGNSLIAGAFFPVNESIWEHLKLAFWPLLCWWLIWYFVKGKKLKINKRTWIISALISIITCILFIVAFFYTYTGAFGIESTVADILSLLFGLILGQMLALHTYRYGKFSKTTYVISIVILVLLCLIFLSFTFFPPHIPLYKDSLNQLYGISH